MATISYYCARLLAKAGQNKGKLSSKKIYLVRHGQTDFNLRGIVQGSGVDSSLNDFGRAQASAFFSMYNHVPFDKIYTSALKRSQQSVEAFIKKGISFEAFAGLNEISWGTKEGQSITPEEDEYYHYMLRQWNEGNTGLKIEGGESPEDVVIRMKPAVDYIFSQEHEKTILICMHGRAIRILLCYLLNLPLKSMDSFEHQNLGLYLLDYKDGAFTIELHNDLTHLRDLD
jgi:broad specificity phosphatase PhoE